MRASQIAVADTNIFDTVFQKEFLDLFLHFWAGGNVRATPPFATPTPSFSRSPNPPIPQSQSVRSCLYLNPVFVELVEERLVADTEASGGFTAVAFTGVEGADDGFSFHGLDDRGER